MAQEPGTHFAYSSGASELLAFIFQKETGQDIEAYAEQHSFKPLGMKHHWKRSPSGLIDTEGGLYLTGDDLAKLGDLYLLDGMWNGQRLLTQAWVAQATAPFVDTGWQGLKYGFQWWLYPRKDEVHFVWMGIGFGGQRLMIFPEERLIAVFTGWDIIKDPDLDAALAERMIPVLTEKSCPAE